MLLTQAQYNRLVTTFRPGSSVRVGSTPDSGRQAEGPGWNPKMEYFVNASHIVKKLTLVDRPITADGQVLYDVWIRLQEPAHGIMLDFALEWLDDPKLVEALDGIRPMAVATNVPKLVDLGVAKTTPIPTESKEDVGFGLAAGGAVALLTGLAAIKKRFMKKVPEAVSKPIEPRQEAVQQIVITETVAAVAGV